MNRTMTLEKTSLILGITVSLLILAISVLQNKLGRSQIFTASLLNFIHGPFTISVVILS